MDTKHYKQKLGNQARDIIAYGIGLQKYKSSKNEACCPFHQEKTPSFKWDSNRYQWKCFGCGETVDIYRYLTDYKNMDFIDAVNEVAERTGGVFELNSPGKSIEFVKPNISVTELTSDALEYMKLRGIQFETLKEFRVKQDDDYYTFQCFDEKNELQHISYRRIGKKDNADKFFFKQSSKTKSILWGMWNIDVTKPVVITEGQFDCMCVWQSGYKNVVSVPSGASNLTWIDNCWDWLQEISEFIIFGDNDPQGQKMINTLVQRLGKVKTKIANHNFKDANECLYHEGPEAVLKYIEDTIALTTLGLINVIDVNYSFDSKENGIPTGIYGLDAELDDLQPQQLSVLLGRNGEGKSTLVNQIICNCINDKMPVFLYSGEMSPERIMYQIYNQVVGNDNNHIDWIKGKYKTKPVVKDYAIEAIKTWISSNFYIFDKSVFEVKGRIDELFKIMEIAIRRHGCRLLIIDNLMSAIEEQGDSLNNDQSNFIQRCKEFVENYDAHIMIVCHPNKAKGRTQKLEKEDISGSNNIPNKADVIISIERQYPKEGEELTCDAKLRLLKNRDDGQYVQIKLDYDKRSRRLTECGYTPKEFNWKQHIKKDWAQIIDSEIQVDDELPFY